MKKLFLFIAAALVSTGMWAADYTLYMATSAGVNPSNVSETGISVTFNGMKDISNSPMTSVANATYGIAAGLKITRWGGSGSGKNIAIVISENYTATVAAYVQVKSNNQTVTIKQGTESGTNVTSVKCAAQSTVYEVKATSLAAGTYYIKANDNVGLIKLVATVNPTCADPEATIIDDAAGYVGYAIDLKFSSNNTNDVVWDIKKGGVATSDASITAGKFTATVAGTYVVTATQAKDATYCAVEESVTLTIADAEKVESVTINDAAATARLNEEVELTMTAANATQYKWYLKKDAGEFTQVATTAGYTFSVEEVGTYKIKCEARNDFNKDGEQNPTWVESSNTHTITVAKSTDATLSDLKVNGTTIDGFAADKYEYTIADPLGVYELLTVTATATDAPYATYATTDNKTSTVTVTVTAEAGNTQDYTIGYTRKAATSLESIGASTTWDWTKAGSATAEQKATTMPTNAEEFNFADVLISPDDEFNAAALNGIAQFANRSDHYFQGNMVKFNTTVAGTVVVTYSNTGGKRPYRHVKVNETMSAEGSANQDQKDTEAINVAAGDVEITFYIPDASEPQSRDGDVVGPSMGRIYKIVFTKSGTVGVDNTESSVKAVKVLKNGVLIIEKNGVRYNMLGERVQ